MKPKRILATYFDSFWVPVASFMVVLGCCFVLAMPHWKPFVLLSDALLYLVAGLMLGVLLVEGRHPGLPVAPHHRPLGQALMAGQQRHHLAQGGESATATLSKGNGLQESHCVIAAGACVVEVFEQSGSAERRLTKAALAQVDRELAALLAAPTVETIRSLLPTGSVRRAEASVALIRSFQPGLYDTELWVNPGEPGMIYLKAFEVTRGIPLSADRLKEKSNEWVGWSDDPGEQYFANTTITIYEGDWGKPYAARFAVWFAPDSGAPEHKLLEKVFKIEGWQR